MHAFCSFVFSIARWWAPDSEYLLGHIHLWLGNGRLVCYLLLPSAHLPLIAFSMPIPCWWYIGEFLMRTWVGQDSVWQSCACSIFDHLSFAISRNIFHKCNCLLWASSWKCFIAGSHFMLTPSTLDWCSHRENTMRSNKERCLWKCSNKLQCCSNCYTGQ